MSDLTAGELEEIMGSLLLGGAGGVITRPDAAQLRRYEDRYGELPDQLQLLIETVAIAEFLYFGFELALEYLDGHLQALATGKIEFPDLARLQGLDTDPFLLTGPIDLTKDMVIFSQSSWSYLAVDLRPEHRGKVLRFAVGGSEAPYWASHVADDLATFLRAMAEWGDGEGLWPSRVEFFTERGIAPWVLD